MNATSVVAGVEEIRNAVCPRTSYATAGEAAYSLYLVSEGSTELSKKLEDAFKQGKEFNRVDALDRNEFVTKCTSGQIAGHVLVFVCPKDISPQSITNLVTTRKTNLVFALHDSTGDVSKLQQVYREQCAGDATVAFDTWSHCHVMYCYRRGAYTNTTAREFGYSKQPSVQSRNQFRFLWSTPEGSDGKLRVLQRLSDKASSRSGTKLSVDTWDQRVTDILRKKGGDFDVYSMVRQECVGSSLEADLVIKRLDGAGVEKDASNGDQGKVVSAEEDGEDGRANFMVKMTLQCLPQGMKGRIRNVLDYGCAEGAITAALCKELQLPPERGFGADVRAIPSPGFTFVQLPSEGDVPGQVGSILPTLPNGSMDLVCSAMVFHHVRHVEVMFRELRRVISPNGCLIIREHNCQGKSDAAFLDVTHGLFSLAWSDPVEWPAFIEE
jgi:SAM-dependent methyltransferase